MQLEKVPFLITTVEESPNSQFEKSTLSHLERSPTSTIKEEFPCCNYRGGCKRQLEISRPTANKERTPTAIRVEPMLHLESSLLHIAVRQGPVCILLLQRICPRFMNLVHEESPPQL